jgi:hypothetical protein
MAVTAVQSSGPFDVLDPTHLRDQHPGRADRSGHRDAGDSPPAGLVRRRSSGGGVGIDVPGSVAIGGSVSAELGVPVAAEALAEKPGDVAVHDRS